MNGGNRRYGAGRGETNPGLLRDRVRWTDRAPPFPNTPSGSCRIRPLRQQERESYSQERVIPTHVLVQRTVRGMIPGITVGEVVENAGGRSYVVRIAGVADMDAYRRWQRVTVVETGPGSPAS